MAFLFESETCSRCGGSGQHSYCQRYGSVCFKCSGNKAVLTKRGSAAQQLYRKLLSKPVSALQPGMKIQDIGVTMGGDVFNQWLTVVEVKADNTLYNGQVLAHYRNVECTTKRGELHSICVPVTTMYRVAATPQQKAAALDVAMAYQRSLNKQGKPDKTLAKIAKEVAWA